MKKRRETTTTTMSDDLTMSLLSLLDGAPAVASLEHPNPRIRCMALKTLATMPPASLAQHANAVVALLGDSDEVLRVAALAVISHFEPATLAQHADAVLARLDDSDPRVRACAMDTLFNLEPATLAQHADAVVARLDDSDELMRVMALAALIRLEPATYPATYARQAGALAEWRHDPHYGKRIAAITMLAKLETPTLSQHACAILESLNDSLSRVRKIAAQIFLRFPRRVTRGLIERSAFKSPFNPRALCPKGYVATRPLLLGRLGWFRYRLRWRVKCLALYWYALPYRPGGPGHVRDADAFTTIFNK